MWSSYSFRSPSTSSDGPAKESALLAAGRPVEITVRNLDAELPAEPAMSDLNASSSSAPAAPLSMGWLLRLFRSDFFDAFMAVTYLYRYRDSRGVHDYLCNELYKLSDADLETFMPQVCNLLVFHARDSPGLERFVMDKCADSMHMALQVYFFLQAAVEDAARANNKEAEARVRLLRTRCETAAVNGSRHVMLAAAADRISAATLVAVESPFSQSRRQIDGNSLFPSSSAGQLSVKDVSRIPASCDPVPQREANCRSGTDTAKDDIPPKGSMSGKDDNEGGAASTAEQPIGSAGTEMRGEEDDVDRMGALLQDALIDDKSTPVVRELAGEPESPPAPGAVSKEEACNDSQASCQDAETPPASEVDPVRDFDPLTLLTMKHERYDYFNDSVAIARAFVRLSLTTRDTPEEQRRVHLAKGLEQINDILLRRMKGEPGTPLVANAPVPHATDIAKLGRKAALRSLHLPLTRASSHALRILRVNSDEAVILTSRTRAPYMVNIEVLPTDMLCSDKLLFCEQRVIEPSTTPNRASLGDKPPRPTSSLKAKTTDSLATDLSATGGSGQQGDDIPIVSNDDSSGLASARQLSEMTPAERQRANVRKSVYGNAHSRQPEVFSLAEEASDRAQASDADSADSKARQAVILGVYGELWSWKEERILNTSPFKNLKDTRLMPFIVKAGDDLRQEQLAIQLISQFQKIFDEEGVDVFLRPFTVVSVSSEAGFVEVITDAVSVHSLKKRTPNFVSLLDYFERAYGINGTRSFRAAQRRFIRSMAGYSLVTYFLQIKDRHNGNIMIDVKGRIIHIDFGFMLTNSPGAIKFENVPFKLTEEYLQVICAKKNVQDLAEASKTEGYRYFQELFVLGLLAAKKHYEKITTLVEIMAEGTTMPCMTGGHSIVEALRSRFAVGMPEEQCINFALSLIEESRLSWRSAGYDRFQAYSNGYR